ncbi:MAG: glycosyltransferase [Desulfovibrio sp.]|jgi:spore maturation protein CgeB|nr:glycosyltransferase [Desulfovibrio sp.]
MPQGPLRILVVLPMYGGSLPIGRYCARALQSMGHSVRLFEAPLLYPAFTGLQRLGLPPAAGHQLENSFLQLVSQSIWAHAQALEPHLVLALAQAPLNRNLLQRLRRSGVRTAMWFVEDYRIFDYWRLYAPLYDVFAVIQKKGIIDELARIGQNNAFYLPLAALPDFHKPVRLTAQEKREYEADMAFLGAGYPNRRLAFRHLAGRNFKIWGSDWEGESLLAGNIQRQGARVSEEESVKIYNASKININLHSSLQTAEIVSRGDFVNPRTFELAAAGAFQLVDERSLLGGLFGADELATFTSAAELYAKIDYFSSRPEEREAYAGKARNRVLREHTYAHRMASLLDYIARQTGPWPQGAAKTDFPPELGSEFYADFERLTHKLGLGPHAPFEDVIACLRRQSGALDDLETSLLFLDEWRKQYLK